MVLGAAAALAIAVSLFVPGVAYETRWLAVPGFAGAGLALAALALIFAGHPGAPTAVHEIRQFLAVSLLIFLIAGAVHFGFRMLWDLAPPGWYYPLTHGVSGVAVLVLVWRQRTTLTPDGRFAGITLALLWLSFAVWLGSDAEEASAVFAVPGALVVAGITDAIWRRIVPARYSASGLAKTGGYLVPALAGLLAAVLLMGALDSVDARSHVARGDAWRQKGDNDRAIADYNEAILLSPEYAFAYASRGYAWRQKGDIDRAIADYSEAIRLDPNYAWAFASRGSAWRDKGDLDRAIADYGAAIRINPKDVWAYNDRANAWRAKGDRSKALADYDSATRADAKNHGYFNEVAWMLATDPGFAGHGKRAVELATQACELTSWRNPYYLDTLAAAYAAAGNFEQAVRWQEKALEFPDFAENGKDAAGRLALYRSRKPYRQ